MNLFSISDLTLDELSRLRLRYVQVLAAVILLIGVIGLVSIGIVQAARGVFAPLPYVALGITLLVGAAALWLVQRGEVRWAAVCVIGVLLLGSFESGSSRIVLAALALLSSAALTSTPVFLVINGIITARYIAEIAALFRAEPNIAANPALTNEFINLVTLLVISAVMRYFINAAQRSVRAVRRSASLLQATADIADVASRSSDLNGVLTRAVELIRDNFGYYHVQIFLVSDNGSQVVLAAATGEPGQILLARGLAYPVGTQNIIGQVALRGDRLIVTDSPQDPLALRLELLPGTRSQLALPLKDGDRLLGVIDIHSSEPNSFSRADVQALQILVELIETTVRNTRLLEAQRQTALDNQRLYLESEANLREIRRLNQRLTSESWQTFIDSQMRHPGVTLQNERLLPDAAWSQALVEASQQGEPVRDGKVVAVPVKLRGEVIGAIEVEAASSGETVEIVESIAQRLATSLESARLYEATQEAAAHEQRINDIAARYQTVASVDELLRVTLVELSKTLGAQRGAIRLGRVEASGENPV